MPSAEQCVYSRVARLPQQAASQAVAHNLPPSLLPASPPRLQICQSVPFVSVPAPNAAWTCGLQLRGNFTCSNGECGGWPVAPGLRTQLPPRNPCPERSLSGRRLRLQQHRL